MTSRSPRSSAHELTGVTEHPDGGWSATCKCGFWGYAGAPSKKALNARHAEHVREAGGGRR